MRKSISVGRLFGVELLLDTSWIVIFGLVVWSLTSVFGAWHPTWTSGTLLAVALVTGVSFFVSVLLHEMAHTLAAKAYGLPVRDITLHMFGGVSNIEREPPTPGAELTIAIVGPLASFVLGVGMLVVAGIVTGASIHGASADDLAATMSRLGPTTTLLMWLGPVNIAISLFNLIPGFPMDGGRILRAVLWKATGNLGKATRWSTAVGQGVGFAFIAGGAMMVLGVRLPFFGTGLVSGIWLAFIGMFLRGAAKRHQIGAEVADALEGLHVRALMRLASTGVQGNTSLRALVDQWFVRREEAAFPVFFGDRYIGVVALVDVMKVPQSAWDEHTAREIMRSPEGLPPIGPSDPVVDALRKVGVAGLTALPVVEDGVLVGMLFETDVARWVALHRPGAGAGTPRPRYV